LYRILNIHGVNDVRQTEIHTAEPLVSEPSAAEFQLAIEKVKSHKSPGLVKYRQNWLKQGIRQFAVGFIKLLFLFVIRRNYLRIGRSRSQYLSIRSLINGL